MRLEPRRTFALQAGFLAGLGAVFLSPAPGWEGLLGAFVAALVLAAVWRLSRDAARLTGTAAAAAAGLVNGALYLVPAWWTRSAAMAMTAAALLLIARVAGAVGRGRGSL